MTYPQAARPAHAYQNTGTAQEEREKRILSVYNRLECMGKKKKEAYKNFYRKSLDAVPYICHTGIARGGKATSQGPQALIFEIGNEKEKDCPFPELPSEKEY